MNKLDLITSELDHFPVVTPKYRLHLIRRNTHKGLELEGTITIQRGKRSRTVTTGIVTTECLSPGDQILATTETRDGYQAWNMVDEIDGRTGLNTADTGTALEQQESGDRLDPMTLGHGRAVIDVELPHHDLVGHDARELFDHGSDLTARTAPGGPEVDQHGLVALEHVTFEIRVGKFLAVLSHLSLLPKDKLFVSHPQRPLMNRCLPP